MLDKGDRLERQRELQTAIADAHAAIERAKDAANALKASFVFLGRTYTPLTVLTQGGHFDHEPSGHEAWEASDDSTFDPWASSGAGIAC